MGKNLIQQRRGKGTPTFRSLRHRYKGKVSTIRLTSKTIRGRIIDIIDCPGHSAPLLEIEYEKEKILSPAPEGIKVGDYIEAGKNPPIKIGNILPLREIPEGTLIYNIERVPGEGGEFVRASGVFAKVVSRLTDKVIVQMPSKKQKEFGLECRASIGIVAGGGRPEKPFLKAGNRYFAMKSRNKFYPRVGGVSMNAVDHPFGGSSSHTKGRPTQASRNAPPGRKVGKIAPSRTGRRKR